MSLFDDVFGDHGKFWQRQAEETPQRPMPMPAPQSTPLNFNHARAEVLKEIVRKKVSYVKTGGKTYKVTAVEVEVTGK